MRHAVFVVMLVFCALGASPRIGLSQVTYEPLWDTILELDREYGKYVAVMDFDGDGYEDLLLGHVDRHTIEKTPLLLLMNSGDGTFDTERGAPLIGDVRAANPKAVSADFNGDGKLDVAIFDGGNTELGQDPVVGGFQGEVPMLLLSNDQGEYINSTALEDAERIGDPEREGKLHIKYVSAGDIDNDGDVDIYVESGGGVNRPGHFLVNNGDATFTTDGSDERIGSVLRDGFRYFYNVLHDMNNDGYVDLILGQLRRINNNQEELASTVVLNDGGGNFNVENSIDLPYANWNAGWTYVHSIEPFDLNGDEFPDLILGHQKAFSADTPDEANSALYIQFLINNDGTFSDDTMYRIGDQSQTSVSYVDDYGLIFNSAELRMLDMNNDGHQDLVTTAQGTAVDDHAPFIYLNDGTNRFSGINSDDINHGMMSFGENAYPLHLNDDEFIDLVHTDLRPGQDEQYGTGDETTTLISMLATQVDPTHAETYRQLPDDFGLSQNYPNPFKTVTTIAVDLPKPSHVTLKVYTLMGQKVATLLSADQPAGHYTMTWDATDFASGVYVYRLQAGDYSVTRKLLLLK